MFVLSYNWIGRRQFLLHLMIVTSVNRLDAANDVKAEDPPEDGDDDSDGK